MNKILKEAARRVAEDEQRFSCLAVRASAGSWNGGVIEDKYSVAFSPRQEGLVPQDFEINPSCPTDRQLKNAKDHRVMALLFAAEAWNDL